MLELMISDLWTCFKFINLKMYQGNLEYSDQDSYTRMTEVLILKNSTKKGQSDQISSSSYDNSDGR